MQGGRFPGCAGGRSGTERKRRLDFLQSRRPAQTQICRQQDLLVVDQPHRAVPGKLSIGAQAVRRESGNEFAAFRTEPGSRPPRTSRLELVISGLQLGEIFDAFPDTPLKRFLQ